MAMTLTGAAPEDDCQLLDRATERTLLAEFSSHPPVCVLFALCESSVRGGRAKAAAARGGSGGASPAENELQPLLWQLLELTLRPEDPSTKKGINRQLSSPTSSVVASHSGSGLRGSGASTRGSTVPITGNAREAGDRGNRAEAPHRGIVALMSPAQLLIAKGLVGPETLVTMAQDLLAPGAGAEARKRTAQVLQHLWDASPPEVQPEVRWRKGERCSGV